MDDRDIDSRISSRLGEERLYSRDYAWCFDLERLNDLIVSEDEAGIFSAVHRPWPLVVGYGANPRVAKLSWLEAALIDKRRVALPGGRVIEGRAA
jgi:hypothetical protein